MFGKSAKRTILFSSMLSALVTVTPRAMAGDYPFHVDADMGRASVDEFNGVSIDESSTAFRLGTGYRFRPWIGISGAYVDLGTIDSSVDDGTGSTIPLEASANGFELVVTGRVVASDALSFTVNAGGLRWRGDTNVGGMVAHDNGNGLTWGVGAEYTFARRYAVTGAWRRYTIGNVDSNTIWLGLSVRFGDTP